MPVCVNGKWLKENCTWKTCLIQLNKLYVYLFFFLDIEIKLKIKWISLRKNNKNFVKKKKIFKFFPNPDQENCNSVVLLFFGW